MLINELDADILRLVAASVAQSRQVADIVAFAITCRAVYKAARPFIPSWLSMDIPSDTFMLLRRTLTEDQTYGLGAYSLRVGPCKTRHELAQKYILDFFQLLPNLRILLAYDESLNIIPILLSPETSFRRSLRTLFLGRKMQPIPSELLQIARLPKLRQLEIDGLLNFENPDLSSTRTLNSNLTHLKLLGGQIRRRTLSSLIVTSPSLSTLICKTPLDEPSRQGVCLNSAVIGVPFSPISITPTLAPISRTLVELDLSTHVQKWSGHDGTRLDLVNFTKLRHICASAELFVAIHGLGISRNGLFKLLPPSLRTFELDFGFQIGVLFSIQGRLIDQAGYERCMNQTLEPSSYEWIVELARHKHECFKQLKQIKLNDTPYELDSSFSLYEWEPPQHVEELFSGADIELEVSVRGLKKLD